MSETVQNVNQAQNIYQVKENKAEKNTKVDMTDPVDEVKISSKVKKGAKIGAAAGTVLSTLGIVGGTKLGAFDDILKKGSGTTAQKAGLAAVYALAFSIYPALGTGIGAIIGKISDAVSAKKDN